ncbi:MAG: hypothetical protein U0164_08270 [Gemmatimonadaceae bacterium]
MKALCRKIWLKPRRGARIPLRRPGRMSWKTNGSHITGMSAMYSTAGRATITFFETSLSSRDAKW